MPARVKRWLAKAPSALTPSPKFQLYLTIVRPGVARDASALKKTGVVIFGIVGEKTNDAAGSGLAPTVIASVFDAARPRSLVTVSVALNVPIATNRCETVLPLPDEPSPKFQA